MRRQKNGLIYFMRILVIGRDPKLLDRRSEVFQRVREYAALFDRYYVLNLAVHGEIIREGNLTIESVRSRFWGVLKLVKKIVREQGIDTIDAQDAGETGFIAWRVSRATGVPFRLQIHTDVFSSWYRRASWKEYIRYLLARFLIPHADCIRVVSERIKKSLLQATSYKLQAEAIVVLPIWTDVTKFLGSRNSALSPRVSETFKMVAVGRFVDKEKNFSMLIQMMHDFIKVCPNAILTLVGDGPDKKKYESIIKRYGLEKCVTLEKVEYNQLSSFLKTFDLFLLSSNYEGWGRAVIEAMASGIPVVMTDVGLAGEIVQNGENGIVAQVGNKQAFLEAVTDMYKNSERRKKFSVAGMETIKNMKLKTKDDYLKSYASSYCNSKNR
jgi:glycosyltransferase involved in cell wall biosynthesis